MGLRVFLVIELYEMSDNVRIEINLSAAPTVALSEFVVICVATKNYHFNNQYENLACRENDTGQAA